MNRHRIHTLAPIIIFLVLIGMTPTLTSQTSLQGGKGLLRVYSSETIGNGNFCIHLLANYFRPKILVAEEDSLKSLQAGDLHYGLTYGIGNQLELFISGSYLFEFQKGLREGSNHNLGDTQLGLKVGFPPFSFLSSGAVSFLRINTGKESDEGVVSFRQDFTSNSIEYGFLVNASMNFADRNMTVPVNVHLNGGIHMFSENRVDSSEDMQNRDTGIFGIGLELPSRHIDFFMELTTRQLYNRKDLDFGENLFLLTPGVRVKFPKGISALLAADFNISREPAISGELDGDGVPVDIDLRNYIRTHPSWRIHLGLSISSIVRLKDMDDDGIPDHLDGDPLHPEDFDGFEDDDGIPDYDNDLDGIPDICDLAPNDPEDIDGFNDADGIPDPDNDMDGILDVDDECPNEPEDIDGDRDWDGCPDLFVDTDGDGIADELDMAPTVPEDFDGFEDEDGAPDYDNDADGIPDDRDECPNEPETFNDYRDQDGCPDLNVSRIVLDGIKFPSGSARIKPEFHSILAQASEFLMKYPDLEVVIEGYTDNIGDRNANIALSRKRAEAVRLSLIQEFGIDHHRLQAKGYGPDHPIADNATPDGRTKNRRIEFYFPKWD